MFSNFISEKIEYTNTSLEIHFFDENILAKKNRSKFHLVKVSTPFLSDTTEYLRETFTVPLPSTFGIPENHNYSYPSFPNKFNSTLFGTNIRKALILVEQPEKRRLQDNDSANNYLVNMVQLHNSSTKESISHLKKVNKEIFHKITRNRNIRARSHSGEEDGGENSGLDTGGSVGRRKYLVLERKLSSATSALEGKIFRNNNNGVGDSKDANDDDNNSSTLSLGGASMLSSPMAKSLMNATALFPSSPSTEEHQVHLEEKKFYKLTRDYFYFILSAIITMQSLFRQRKHYLKYKKLRRTVRSIQLWYRYYHLQKLKKNKVFMKQIIKIQKNFRKFSAQKLYRTKRHWIILLQSLFRCQKLRKQFLILRKKFILIQSLIRKYICYERFNVQLIELSERRKRQVALLWMIERTSLYYRSLFWFVINNLSYYIPLNYLGDKNYSKRRTEKLTFSLENPSQAINKRISRETKDAKNRSASATSSKKRKFPLTERTISCLTIAFYDEECMRLYHSLGVKHSSSPFHIVNFTNYSFTQQFEMIENLLPIKRLKEMMKEIQLVVPEGDEEGAGQSMSRLENNENNIKGNILKIDQFLLQLFQSSSSRTDPRYLKNYQEAYQQETSDRMFLYSIFQKYKTQLSTQQEDYFKFFHIADRKRRKRKLAHYLFMNSLYDDYLNYSAEIVLMLLDHHHHSGQPVSPTTSNVSGRATPNVTRPTGTSSIVLDSAARSMNEKLYLTKTLPMTTEWIHQKEWLLSKKQQLMTKFSLEVIQACLVSIERLRNHNRENRNKIGKSRK
jgi:hypothetical protein